ncbi:MAG: sensor histidine kinase KdpD [Chloroflexi bacterium]|nr:sensor histidine kinase KdpD [Chloroflexota bacterium]
MRYNNFMVSIPTPDPDQIIAQTQSDKSSTSRGRLKIFLGYAAGVGKTYAMLEAAHQRRKEGVDVVIGYVETHARTETDARLVDLEIIPRKSIDYHNHSLLEMDVDIVLSRHPQLTLVDELAHTNAPGSRHPKRYQDVKELLDAGIDVYTTLNIQHLESLNDVVAQITGVLVDETIPDKVLDEASELELIDLPPDELLKRLAAGKVNMPEQASLSIDKFFRKGNLTALREITLRRTAERVDEQMRDYMESRAINQVWAASERIVVCVSPNGLGERLVRSARRLADELNAEWTAIYIETPAHLALPSDEREQIASSLHLAEELGARVQVIPASGTVKSIANAIMDYARKHNITKIVAGKPTRPRWFDLLRGSLVDELIYHSGEIDIHVITSNEPAHIPPEENPLRPHSTLNKYLLGVLLTAAATSLGYLVELDISPTNLVMIYLLAVVIAAIYLGRGPAILVSALGVAAFDFFFVPPYYTLAVSDTEYFITFTGLFVVGVVISALAVRAREQAESAQRREADTAILYSLSRDLAAAEDLQAVIKAVRTHLDADFGRDVVIYLPGQGDSLTPHVDTDSFQPTPGETELNLALWSYHHAEPAGLGTNTLPSAEPRFIPLKTSRHTVGVLSLKPLNPSHPLNPDQRRMLESFANQTAQAIERVHLAEQARQIKLLQAAEKLQNALLNSISHDLRTPLVSITGALTTLEAQGETLAVSARQSLVETARQEADRLNRLVGNLLDMTRLKAGALKVKREPADIQDVIGTAIGQMDERLIGRDIRVAVPDSFPLFGLDFVLIVHVITNLLDNALKYSPENSPLEIRAQLAGTDVQISVMDRGLGIPEDDLEHVFDKFYRVQRPNQVTGTGLGLAICKGIIEAHGGHIHAENRPGGGTVVTIALPV